VLSTAATAATPRLAMLQMAGTLSADHPPATLVLKGHGFQAGEVVKVSGEVDGPGALMGPTSTYSMLIAVPDIGPASHGGQV